MATRKKEDELALQQTGYGAEKLTSRTEVENAMAGAEYRPSQNVTDAAAALKEWQLNRPADHQSSYQGKIDSLLEQLLERETFQYSYTQDPLYRQYAQVYTQNAHNASADAAAQAAALTGGYGSSYATSAAQQAYQQQIGALSNAIPTLYSLALDTYNSGGDELVTRLDQLTSQEQNEQERYQQELSDYYTQLERMGDAYNDAYAKDYGQYQDYLSRLDTLYGYYSTQEQAQAAQKQQRFNNAMTLLGLIGDAVQIAISGTTGIGSMLGGLMNTGYNIYAGNREYEADRADAQWSQQMQEKLRQDDLAQQKYDNTANEREYQDALKQQQFNNQIASEKLNIAKGEWALKQADAKQKTMQASAAQTKTATAETAADKTTLLTNLKTAEVPYSVQVMRSQGKSDTAISTALRRDGYTPQQIAQILKKLNQ